MAAPNPRLLVLSSLFPSDAQPGAGLFIRERMFRVATHLPIVVVAPQPWFPFQGLIRRFRPHFRPSAAVFEIMDGVEIHRPRYLCFPGVLKWTDGFLMALSSLATAKRLKERHRLNIIDAHFGYPDGYAASLLGRWLSLPVIITLRGKEERQLRMSVAGPLRRAIRKADRLVSVSEALRRVAIEQGADADRVTVIGNGIDLDKFRPVPKLDARRALDLPEDATVLVSVGTLVERKGFHRVISCLPPLVERFPNLLYLIVGGSGPEGNIRSRLEAQASDLGLSRHVRFLGPCAPKDLRVPLSAADLFVLATSYEGWANVFLEAMACGLPVVTTRVGGNEQVICSEQLGILVDLGDSEALVSAISAGLERRWDRERIKSYASENAWDLRIETLLKEFPKLLSGHVREGYASRARRATRRIQG